MFKVKCISVMKKGSHVFRILSALFWSFFDLAFFLSALASLVFCRVPSLWLPNCVRQSPSQAVAGSAVVVLRRRQRTMNDHEKDRQRTISNPIHFPFILFFSFFFSVKNFCVKNNFV